MLCLVTLLAPYSERHKGTMPSKTARISDQVFASQG